MATSKFCLSISLPYNENIHGNFYRNEMKTGDDWLSVINGFICVYRIPLDDFYNKTILDEWTTFMGRLPNKCHIEIVENLNIELNISPDAIVTTDIIKTYFIRIIQRKWKKLYYKMIMRRMNPINLRVRELTGKFPKNCYYVLN